MKIIYILFLISSFMSCESTNSLTQKFNENDLELVSSYVEPWESGKGNVSGIYYKVVLNAKSRHSITFDSLYINNSWHSAILEDENPFVVMASVTNSRGGEPVVLEIDNDPKREEQAEILESRFHNKNVLLYRVNGVKKYFDIGEFQNSTSFTK